MSILLLILAMQASQPAIVAGDDIIVVGRRLRSNLEACIARACPPAEEIDAALALAVGEFNEGRYEDAKSTLMRSVRRNRRHQAEEPRRVASLYATLGDVSKHEGDDRLHLSAVREARSILERQVGADERGTLLAGLDLGDAMMAQGAARDAERVYRATQRSAVAAGQRLVAAILTVRRANLAQIQQRRGDADALLDEALALGGSDPSIVDLISRTRTQFAAERAGPGGVDRMLARQGGTSTRPVLIYSPAFPSTDNGGLPALQNVQQAFQAETGVETSDLLALRDHRYRLERSDEIGWVDVGFWIRPDGRVADPAVLRSSGNTLFARLATHHIGGRRYMPLVGGNDGLGRYQVERLTERPTWDTVLGTRIRRRTGPREVHVVDLTGHNLYDGADHPTQATPPS